MLEARVRIDAKAPRNGRYAMPGNPDNRGLSNDLSARLLREA